MKEFDLQDLFDGISVRMQRERSATQLTLGKLIAALEAMPPGAEVANLNAAHSYRGYYEDLAFEKGTGLRPASELLAECRAAMGQVFEGYKGGDFVMGALTPLWVANYGNTGLKLLAVHEGGAIETGSDDD